MESNRVLGLTVESGSHVRKCPRCNGAPSWSRVVGLDLCRRYRSGATMSDERSTFAMLMDNISMCPCSWYVSLLHDQVVYVLDEENVNVNDVQQYQQMDRLLCNGHELLSHLGDLRAKIGPGSLRQGTPLDTPICNVCRRSSHPLRIKTVSNRSNCHSPPPVTA
jgi:hypothetical protein